MKDCSVLLGLLYFAQALSPEPESGSVPEDKAIDRFNAAVKEAITAVRHYQRIRSDESKPKGGDE